MSHCSKEGDNLPPKFDNKMEFIQGARMEAKDFTNKWYPIKIVQVDWGDREVLVHFEQWSSRYDEWIKIDSDRLRPSTKPVKPRSKKREFRIGDKVLAPWSDNRKYPAKLVTKYADGTCEIMFFDGFSKRIKQNSLCELSSNQANKIGFDEAALKARNSNNKETIQTSNNCMSKDESSTVGSKEERRARKRKLVVSELFSHHKRLKKEDEEAPSLPQLHETSSTEQKADAADQHDHKCLVDDCTKEFRNKKLLMMHIKHYHPNYTNNECKSVSVMEMAHQRVGDGEIIDVKSKCFSSKAVNQPDLKYTRKTFLENKVSPGYEKLKHKKKNKCNAKKMHDKDLSQNDKSSSSNFGDEDNGDTGEMSLCETNPILTFELENSTDVISDSKETPDVKYLNDDIATDTFQIKKRESESEDTETYYSLKKRKRLSSSKSSLKYEDKLALESALCDLDDNISLAPSVQEESEETEDSVIETEYDLINCRCGDNEEEGLMIQCEWCYTWQHGVCHNINVETDVPDKYVCKTCLNPKNERSSRRYSHDQDWLKQGTLHQFDFVGSKENDNFRSLMKKTNDLILLVLTLKSVARCLRHKLNISGDAKHPKLVQWAKPWPTRESLFNSEFENPLLSDSTPLTENTQLNVGLIEAFPSTNMKLGINQNSQVLQPCISTVTSADSNTNLLSSLSDTSITDRPELPYHAEKSNESNFVELSEGSAPVARSQYTNLYHNLHDRIEQWSNLNMCCPEPEKYPTEPNQNSPYIAAGCEAKEPDEAKEGCDFLDGKQCTNEDLSAALPPICTNSLNQPGSYRHFSGPVPETPIDMKECQLNLLDHIEDVENLLDKTLEMVEAQLTAVENNIEWCTSLHLGKWTELMQLLSRDLETIRRMATC